MQIDVGRNRADFEILGLMHFGFSKMHSPFLQCGSSFLREVNSGNIAVNSHGEIGIIDYKSGFGTSGLFDMLFWI